MLLYLSLTVSCTAVQQTRKTIHKEAIWPVYTPQPQLLKWIILKYKSSSIALQHDILASRFKVQGDQLLLGQLLSRLSDLGTLFSPSNTVFLDVSSKSQPK